VKREISGKLAHRLLAGRPTCLVTTRYRGEHNVMTLSWACPISLVPPLLMLAIHPATHSHGLLLRGEECVLNIPARPLGEQLVRYGTRSGADSDKLRESGVSVQAGHRVQALWIDDCLAHIECAVVERLAPGDHSLFIVEIVGAWAEEEAFTETWHVQDTPEDLLPVIHLGGSTYGLWGTEIQLG